MALSRAVAVLLLLAAFDLSAQVSDDAISTDPPDPTSADSVTLLVKQVGSCPPSPTLTRDGFNINVTLHGGPCLYPPLLITWKLELGTLAPGSYTVNVGYSGQPSSDTMTFLVLDANANVIVSQSIGSTAGGTPVDVVVSAPQCLNQPPGVCPTPAITFDGIPATNVVLDEQGHIHAVTPPHAAGAVLVKVVVNGLTNSSYAFRYIDPAAPPSPKFYDRALIPVIFNGPGAFGSNWVTELSLRNDNAFTVEPWRAIGGKAELVPRQPLLFSGDAPGGLFVGIPLQASASLALHAGVRDTSRADSEWSTEIPIVREKQFSTTGIDLLDIPADPRYRTMLRIYSTENPVFAYNSQVHVIVYSLENGGIYRSFFASLNNGSGCTDAGSCAEHPSSVAVPDVTAGNFSGRVGVEIQSTLPIWAFATVTNNETQHVTIVSPR
ncbi:MAG TPA: hypothetical protein VGR95_03880 [Thermoanaerobaculia bacterium]|jgi:hypothetical protein|nr:hypothetical protein [Thermoanaerobaculia bacterium]